MTTTAILTDEVFTGAGASATMIPECDIYLPSCDLSSVFSVVDIESASTETVAMHLVPNLYVGCMAKVVNTTSADYNGTYMIKSNTINSITFGEDVGDAVNDDIAITIQAFGAPSPAPNVITGKPTLLADNWLGLVNTITPPSVEVEVGQLNLALGGSRNFGYQFKKGETVSGGSLDISMSNGSWLYYVLGDYTVANGASAQITARATDSDGSNNAVTYAITAQSCTGAFTIGQASGAVTVADTSAIDYEAGSTCTLTVQAASADTSTRKHTHTHTHTPENQ